MLRSTGFFRGIDCPFYAEYKEDKGTKNGCNRPYCHFRHSRSSYGTPADPKKQRELHSAQKGAEYFYILYVIVGVFLSTMLAAKCVSTGV